jgi:hypothetical protein
MAPSLRRRRGWTTVAIYSGLGNQLFQYAAGRSLAKRTGTRLRFDLSFISHEPDRPYVLGDFHIRAEVFDGERRDLTFMDDREAEAAYARERWGATVVRDRAADRGPQAALAAQANSFLDGYWQDERCFEDCARLIRRELRPRRTDAIRAGARLIASAPRSVAVHVRRGDLARDPGSQATFGTLPTDYYRRATALVLEHSPNAEFFVFSDDPEWCAQELELAGPTHIVSGENAPFEDLSLMAKCDDAVVANSTFSWWGAWLGESEGSIVVAPEVPFKAARLNDRAFYPARWLRV